MRGAISPHLHISSRRGALPIRNVFADLFGQTACKIPVVVLQGRIILKLLLNEYDVKIWSGGVYIRMGSLVNAVMNLQVP
jgi:hypothetical protein